MRAMAMPGENPNALRQPDEVTPAFVHLADPRCHKNGQIIKA